MAGLVETGAVTASAATPILARQLLDPAGNSLTRPSVLLGLGLGGALAGSAMLVRNGAISAPVGGSSMYSNLAGVSGAAMMGAGIASALVPSNPGNAIALPV